jgi:hypothetical protein
MSGIYEIRDSVNRLNGFISTICVWPPHCQYNHRMLRIRRSEGGGSVIFSLSGRIEEQHVSELQQLLASDAGATDITLDLEEVRLVDRGAVKFLSACEGRGIKLKQCASYIREWIETGSDTSHEL